MLYVNYISIKKPQLLQKGNSTKEDIQMANKHMKRRLILLVSNK